MVHRLTPAALFVSTLFLTGGAGVASSQVVQAATLQLASGGGTITIDPASGAVVRSSVVGTEGAVISSASSAATAAAAKVPSLLEGLKKIQFNRSTAGILAKLNEEAQAAEAPPFVGPPRDPNELVLGPLQRDVALGRWAQVGKFFEKLAESERKPAFLHVITSLGQMPQAGGRAGAPPQQQPMMNMGGGNVPPGFQEANQLSPADVLALADLCPVDLDPELVARLGGLLSAAFNRGSLLDETLAALEKGTAKLGGTDKDKRQKAARLLAGAGRPVEAGKFLAPAAESRAAGDAESLNLLAVHFLGLFDKEGKPEHLEKAWLATQDALAIPTAKDDARSEALERAVDLATRVKAELGKKWLLESFTAQPVRGMEILSSIGTQAAQARRQVDSELRRKKIELQTRAVQALLEAAPQRTAEWGQPLTLLAINWMKEARYSQERDTSTRRGPSTQYDPFGNIYYMNDMMEQQQRMGGDRMPQAIPTGKLLDVAPDEKWISAIESGLQPALHIQLAELFLKVKDDKSAFPYIEKLAATHPDDGKRLAERFIEVWTENHDPNSDKRRTNRYMYMYGYNPGLEGIPLTRSKQERNLEDLGQWLVKLRALPLPGGVDEAKIARAFMTTHSSAEVYRMENIEKVFGKLQDMKAETLSALVQTMRTNLATVWRSPKVQQEAKTKRTDKEIQKEVLRGYEVSGEILLRAQAKYPEDWSLQLAHAGLLFDENNFRNDQQKSPEYTKNRDDAYVQFKKAADLYAKALSGLEESKQSIDPFTAWFYASLGATDLDAVKAEHQPAPKQVPLIKAALDSLPGEAAGRHVTLFANALATRLNAVAPAIKHRYLGAGLKICGEDERAREPRDLFAYYDDLITEVKLETVVDGPDKVGVDEPFGLFVNLKHTKQIEREAGGFGRYLQNQSSQPGYYNFGRPTENYRDKFEEAARESLGESFEIVSVTFHTDKIQSRGIGEDGWRITPYAYLLLKPKGPQVDAVPPLKLNLDFNDTTGYAILPIESAKIPVDASPDKAQPRPVRQVEVKQILDERKSKEGVLALEIKATAHGLVPKLETLLDLKPAEFDVEKIDDQGLHLMQLDAESDENSAVSERLWNVTLRAKKDLSAPPKQFQFAAAKMPEIKMGRFRYEDADLAEVGESVGLVAKYAERTFPWGWALGGLALLGGLVALMRSLRTGTAPAGAGDSPYRVPEEINPLTVTSLLLRIRTSDKLDPAQTAELDRTLSELEGHYYGPGTGAAGPDLGRLAADWSGRVA